MLALINPAAILAVSALSMIAPSRQQLVEEAVGMDTGKMVDTQSLPQIRARFNHLSIRLVQWCDTQPDPDAARVQLLIDVAMAQRVARVRFTFTERQYSFGFEIRNAVRTGSARTLFVQDDEAANEQLSSRTTLLIQGNEYSTSVPAGAESLEYLLRAIPHKLGATEQSLSGVKFTVALLNDRDEPIAADTVRLTIRPSDRYWDFWTTRDNFAKVTTSYQIGVGEYGALRLATAARRPVLEPVYMSPADAREVLVFVPGYNNHDGSIREQADRFFKRMFWLGFRGVVVAFAWRGDSWRVLPAAAPVSDWRALFDPNVQNAFRTAPRFHEFLRDKVPTFANNNPHRVNIVAHSLGNLVAFEALRLARLADPEMKLANNILAVQAAVWKEAFESIEPLQYPSEGYETLSSLDNITYTAAELKSHSWRGWFRQRDSHGVELNLKDVLTGGAFNSFNAEDFALDAMRFNDGLLRSNSLLPFNLGKHYDRSFLNGGVRTVGENIRDKWNLRNVPALMNIRMGFYLHTALNRPLGAIGTPSSNPTLNFFVDGPNHQINARDVGWPERSHGFAFYSGEREDGLTGSVIDASPPQTWQWYDAVFSQRQFVTLGF